MYVNAFVYKIRCFNFIHVYGLYLLKKGSYLDIYVKRWSLISTPQQVQKYQFPTEVNVHMKVKIVSSLEKTLVNIF